MRTIKEVLRLKWEKKLSNKQIATSCNIARSTIRDYLERAQRAGLSWPLTPDLDDGRLEALLFSSAPEDSPGKRGLPAMDYIRKELARKRVTLRLLWLEYRQANPDGYHPRRFLDLGCGAKRAGGAWPMTGCHRQPDSETMESANDVTGWRDVCRICTSRDNPDGAACALIAGGMTARKTGAQFAYRR
ncbi:MAG: hypothetical protein U1D33_00450 [bacterium]|nr:hypothetical protein [bacterium]